MAYRDRKSTLLKSKLLVGLIRFTHWMPAWLSHAINLFAARLSLFFNTKSARVIRRNLELCFPDLSRQERENRLRQHLHQNARLAHEFADAWLASEQAIRNRLVSVEGANLIDQSQNQQRPVILAVPHIGNWEFFWHWLQFNYPLTGMYQPSKFATVDQLVLRARRRFGGELFATDAKGILGLMRSLKQGKVMMILPDQAPREGAGIYSPFFGHSAYTMTLLHKFISKTNAQLIFGACLRVEQSASFHIHLEAPDFEINEPSVERFNAAMNQQIESMICRWPEQYQWSYKRFKRQPKGLNLYQ